MPALLSGLLGRNASAERGSLFDCASRQVVSSHLAFDMLRTCMDGVWDPSSEGMSRFGRRCDAVLKELPARWRALTE
ncbi:hypothetical protein KC19_VG156100 [Ceratodon purpureus]|uniref:Uncharacterized protein n=1 Tax=Ceratodon purpureus TaxID=3225 RepID=A0A8T0HRL5_CERPU|nr:hypothetical protein KC19_VG156100 [Ceratodon purpureus]